MQTKTGLVLFEQKIEPQAVLFIKLQYLAKPYDRGIIWIIHLNVEQEID